MTHPLPPKRKASLTSIFFTFVVDNLGATVVFPVFAPLFLDSSQGLLSPHVSYNLRTLLLGLFLGAFPFAQFFCTPILGEYSDRHGRKKALVFTIALTFLGYTLSAWSIEYSKIVWLFVGRILMGVGAGNLSICLSTLSDLSRTKKEKMRFFSYGSAIAGFTFVLGPFLGGKLSDTSVYHYFDPAFPLWVGSFLSLVNLLFLVAAYKETKKDLVFEPFDFMKGIHNIQLALKTKSIKRLYVIYFFYLFAWNILFLFTPAYLVKRFSATNSTIGDITALMGICWIVGTALIYRFLHKVISLKVILVVTLLCFAIFTGCIAVVDTKFYFILFLGVSIAFSGVIWPICTGVISNAAPSHMQGKVMGLSQSTLSISMVLASLVGGILMHTLSYIPFIIASGMIFVAFLIVWKAKVPEEE